MSEPAICTTIQPKPSPLDVLELRAWARAYLYSIGELTLHQAVDVLQRDAQRDGLVAEIGQDAVQQILADAFGPYRFAFFNWGIFLSCFSGFGNGLEGAS